ncbi:MAG: sulfur carrier protein ThiS [Campylobacteraceae bacterium]|jgi:sulfur carrier protein|nr:sulfur carrier protein ThiS [Campylobacteraceae bacterium]
MTLHVNGQELKTDAKTIKELIKELQIEKQVMAAAVNMNVIKQENWETHELNDNDDVELLRFVGGG